MQPITVQLTSSQSSRLAIAVLSSMLLASCGGDSTGDSPPADSGLSAACSGTFCGAAGPQTYSGSGVGIWRYDNSTSGTVQLPVSIDGVSGKNLTLVFTNTSDTSVSMPSISTRAVSAAPASAQSSSAVLDGTHMPGVNQVPEVIRNYRTSASSAGGERKSSIPTRAALVGEQRNWKHYDESVRAATLRKKWQAADGRVINLWVENSEFSSGKVTSGLVETVAAKFDSDSNSAYPMVTDLAGKPWGPHQNSAAYIGPEQEFNLVLLNFDRDGLAWNVVGYFWEVNNERGNALGNEALALFIDTETLYLAGAEGQAFTVSVMAHELLHMINFYERVMVASAGSANNYAYATWLEEMSALMMEDVVGLRLDPAYHSLRDTRYAQWLGANFNCGFIQAWDDTVTSSCFSYSHAASFGAYLLRHLGVDFYKNLLRDTSSPDSVAVLDHAIRQAGGQGLSAALRDWGTNLALLPAGSSPRGFGYPLRADGGYTLPAVDGPAYAASRRMPRTAPATLMPAGHFPVLRTPSASNYSESISVPKGTSLSIIVR